jgi:hypothetical protein
MLQIRNPNIEIRNKFEIQISRIPTVYFDDFLKSRLKRHPGESRGPVFVEITGFRLSPE